MKKGIFLIAALSLALSLTSVIYADDALMVQMIGREIYAGRQMADGTIRGALFVGKFFNSDFTTEMGRFTVILDHNNEGIEECGGETELRRFKLIMNFRSGAGLVLVGPRLEDGVVNAEWVWDDPECSGGNCPIIDAEDYLYYLDLFDPFTVPNPVECHLDGDGFALIAEIQTFGLRRQWFGSYGTGFTQGSLSGRLVHTPIVSPAIFGSLQLR